MSDTAEEASWYDEATDAVAETWDSTVETVEETWDSTVETVEQTWDSAVETVEETDAATDEVRVRWLQGLVEVTSYPGGQAVLVNLECNEPQVLDSGWCTDPDATIAVGAVAGLAVAVASRFIGLEALVGRFLAQLAGPAAAVWRGYKGFQVQRMLTMQAIPMHEWYGRYVHSLEGEVLAVDFAGVGPTINHAVTAQLEEQLVDAEGNLVYAVDPQELPCYPLQVDYSSHTNMDESSWGDQSLFESARLAKSSGWGSGTPAP